MLFGFAEDGGDTGIGVLNEGTCVAVEVNGLFGVEEHVLSGIHFEDEVFEGTQTDFACHLMKVYRPSPHPPYREGVVTLFGCFLISIPIGRDTTPSL